MQFSALGGAHYKGIFFLLLIFIVLEYFFNTISNSKIISIYNSNSTRIPLNSGKYGGAPLLHILTSRNKTAHVIATPSTSGLMFTLDHKIGKEFDTESPHNNVTLLPDLKNETHNQRFEESQPTDMPLCPDISQTLYGRITVEKYVVPTVEQLEERFSPWLKLGGHWQPEDCRVEKKLAIIIPFRCRGEHLLIFLQHMHPFLKKQQLDYTIVIIEEEGNGPFNRAMLMNIGYTEALKLRDFDCFIFHDVDLLPEDNRNLYTCPEQPRHMSVAVDMFKYRLPYPGIFGGVSAISREHFKLLNGFSNAFWGWGGEDDDMSNRIRYHHLYISRYPLTIARYTMLTHKKDNPSPTRFEVLKQGQKRFDKDGLNSLKYEVVHVKKKLLYTWILAKIEKPR